MTTKLLLVILVTLLLGLQAFEVWKIHTLGTRIDDAEWTAALESKSQEDVITPDVGTIQFLRRGYSIQLDGAEYTGEGLNLTGLVGNPLNLWLSNLTMKFTATKPLYQYRDDFRKDKFTLLFGPQSIGEAQTSPIASLMPRSTQRFEVTIPNVKQTKEGIRIAVTFTGERYSYGL